MSSSQTSSLETSPRLSDPIKWALYGVLISQGAPLGLWLLLLVVDVPPNRDLLHIVFLYTAIGSAVIFAVFGTFAGRLVARLRNASTHDSLTGLSNRRLLMNELPALLANRSRRDEPLCVLMLDLDHFKRVNDTYGHAVGDQTLVAFAAAVKRDVRLGDLVARYGGEEFVIVCPGTDEDAGLAIAERIRESVASLREDELGFDGVQTVSIGITFTRSDTDTPLSLLDRADAALYEAKSCGRDRVCIDRGDGSTPRNPTDD